MCGRGPVERHIHRFDGLETRLQRLLDGLANEDARSVRLDLTCELRVDRTEAVERAAQCVNHAADHLRTNGDFERAARAAGQWRLADDLRLAARGPAVGSHPFPLAVGAVHAVASPDPQRVP